MAGATRSFVVAALARARHARFGLAAAAVYLVVSLAIYRGTPTSQAPGSDGLYSWIFARSLAYDGDVEFTNDYALCGDPFHLGVDRGTGHPDDIFYPGPALVWTPLLWTLRHVVDVRGASPAVVAGCHGPIAALALHASSFVGALVVWLSWLVARRFVPDGVAAVAALLVSLGGHLLFFTTILPSYSHAYDALAVAALVTLSMAAHDAPASRARWAFAGLALGAAILQRPSNLAFAIVPAVAAWHAFGRDRLRAAHALALVLALGLATGALPLALTYRFLYGKVLAITHGKNFVHLGHAHPWLLLFDHRGGLFLYAPALWLAVPGIVLAARRRALGWLFWPLAIAGLVELWVSSAALDWQGARRLSNMTPLFALAVGATLEAARGALRRGRARTSAALGALLVAPTTALGFGVVWAFGHGQMNVDGPMSESVVYGRATATLLDVVADRAAALTTWPAQALFAWRYDLPARAFAAASHPAWYERHFRHLTWVRRSVDLASPMAAEIGAGMHREGAGMALDAPVARLVFAAQWPFADKATFRVTTKEAVDVDVVWRDTWGRSRPWGTLHLEPQGGGAHPYDLAIPPGAFDSGLNELVLRTASGSPLGVTIAAVDLDDGASYDLSP